MYSILNTLALKLDLKVKYLYYPDERDLVPYYSYQYQVFSIIASFDLAWQALVIACTCNSNCVLFIKDLLLT